VTIYNYQIVTAPDPDFNQAELTQARYNQICFPFVNPTSRCFYGYKCYRIHPLDRDTYRQKMHDALAIPITDSVPEPSQEKEKVSV